ncbi:P63C domain-containing protein [Rhizobium tumorigenes]|uniref:P63C domain-containing protein n=1 Tax=Rhizobium tumorigenes TaxID=2041385 RepID=A0AAF1KW32_9HYPH|nr:P63C domain-containing protein [Rhizobium tumorigenes]WFR95709.1 P63C domain-containing protein [Rhizobium tumorigenes]
MSESDKDQSKVAGGRARAESLPATRRSEIASRAAAARWGKTYKALSSGNFLADFGIDVECHVLDDPSKTAVISQRGMGQAIGFSKRGSRLGVFVGSKTMDGYIGRELREKIENPIIFQHSTAAAESPVSTAHGYDATILIDLCNSILAAKADGKLAGDRYARMSEQAQTIVSASAKSGIRGLVYALAGYSPSTDEVVAAFKHYVREEAKKYEKEFPSELYEQWHRLYGISVPERGKPWQFKHLTIKHIYYPLAKSNGKLLELLRALKTNDGGRKTKLFQFLNDIGARALRMHLGRVLEMSESSKTKFEYENKLVQRFGGQQELDLFIPISGPSASQPLA